MEAAIQPQTVPTMVMAALLTAYSDHNALLWRSCISLHQIACYIPQTISWQSWMLTRPSLKSKLILLKYMHKVHVIQVDCPPQEMMEACTTSGVYPGSVELTGQEQGNDPFNYQLINSLLNWSSGPP